MSTDPDVLVIGGGNAALCAALMAREAGASVLLLEAAPREWRGGNSAHTRNLRCMHDAPQDVLVDAYPEEEFWQDLLKVTGGKTNEALARLVIRASATRRPWMVRHGVRFQPSLSGALHTARTNAFFMGGGKALAEEQRPFRWRGNVGHTISIPVNVYRSSIRRAQRHVVCLALLRCKNKARSDDQRAGATIVSLLVPDRDGPTRSPRPMAIPHGASCARISPPPPIAPRSSTCRSTRTGISPVTERAPCSITGW